MLQKIVTDIKPFLLVCLLFNVLFATLYMILEIDLDEEYDYAVGPLKWMVFTFRNAMADF